MRIQSSHSLKILRPIFLVAVWVYAHKQSNQKHVDCRHPVSTFRRESLILAMQPLGIKPYELSQEASRISALTSPQRLSSSTSPLYKLRKFGSQYYSVDSPWFVFTISCIHSLRRLASPTCPKRLCQSSKSSFFYIPFNLHSVFRASNNQCFFTTPGQKRNVCFHTDILFVSGFELGSPIVRSTYLIAISFVRWFFLAFRSFMAYFSAVIALEDAFLAHKPRFRRASRCDLQIT